MKLIAFTDIHASQPSFKKLEASIRKHKPDYVLCAGDFTVFEQNIDATMKRINKLGKVYLIHGNHETESLARKLCAQHKNITYAHKKILKLGTYHLVSHGGGGFAHKDKHFETWIRKKAPQLKNKKLIFMTHAPPYGTNLDYIDYLEDHVGCTSYTTFIKTHKPLIAISGHIHETFKAQDTIGKTRLSNPGPTGEVIKL